MSHNTSHTYLLEGTTKVLFSVTTEKSPPRTGEFIQTLVGDERYEIVSVTHGVLLRPPAVLFGVTIELRPVKKS